MTGNNQLQKDELILPGGLGTINVGGEDREIKKVFKKKDGSTTITISPSTPKPLLVDGHSTGLAFYYPEEEITIAQPKQIENGRE